MNTAPDRTQHALTFNGELCSRDSLAELRPDLSFILRLGHVDGEAVDSTLCQDLVLGAGLYLDVIDEPVDWQVLLVDLALKHGKLILLDGLVLQRSGEGKLSTKVGQRYYTYINKPCVVLNLKIL